jgi:hypothetical protein
MILTDRGVNKHPQGTRFHPIRLLELLKVGYVCRSDVIKNANATT